MTKQAQQTQEAGLKPLLVPELAVAEVAKGAEFTGIARSIQAYAMSASGIDFNNFRVVTLHVEKGKVIKTEYSDPYASFEVLIKMEFANRMSFDRLNTRYENGKAFEK